MVYKTLKTVTACLAIALFSQQVHAKDSELIVIPQLADAQVFASFNDELPAVVNYFTNSSIDEVIAFYENAYGKTVKRETKHHRLALYFNHDTHAIRVIVSEQNNKRQVDVIVNSK